MARRKKTEKRELSHEDIPRNTRATAWRLLGRMAFVAGMMPNDAPLTLEEFAREADFTKLGGRISAEWS